MNDNETYTGSAAGWACMVLIAIGMLLFLGLIGLGAAAL